MIAYGFVDATMSCSREIRGSDCQVNCFNRLRDNCASYLPYDLGVR